jgi:hypothetical protein
VIKKTWLLLLPLVASVLWAGAAPSHAAGPTTWTITGVTSVGCAGNAWSLTYAWSGLDGGSYTFRTQVRAGGKTYMDQDYDTFASDETGNWGLFSDFSHGGVTNPGTYPIAPGQPMTAVFTVERPKGTVLHSWTMVARSCDNAALLYNGPTASDLDGDYVGVPQDGCPAVQAFTATGCPLRDRTLALKVRKGSRRIVGLLSSPGFPALAAGRTVTIWKVRPGPDRVVAIRTANPSGKVKAQVGKGRYYATSPDVLDPASGQAAADLSNRVRVR